MSSLNASGYSIGSFWDNEPAPNLREVGKEALRNINKLGASDAGDLVISMGKLIDELREEPDPAKLDHLEGLFKQLTTGEYVLREDVEEEELGEIQALSGYMPPMNAMPFISGVLPPNSQPSAAAMPPVQPPAPNSQTISSNPCEEEPLVEAADENYSFEDFNKPLQEKIYPQVGVVEEEEKEFKPAWWKKKV